MRREFLQNFKVGEQALPKEVIDAIMDENGRDIEAAKKAYSDYDHIKEQLKIAQDALDGFKDVDVTDLKNQIATLTTNLQNKDTEWQQKLDGINFENAVKDAITAAHGKNAKAIMALLDTETLKNSKNQEADIKSALEGCRTDNPYLFGEEQTPPPFAGGTGSGGADGSGSPMTLAAALREKFERK